MDFKYIDVHSHVSFDAYDSDRGVVVARMQQDGVATIAVGVDYASSKAAVDFAEVHEGVWATIGLHPNDTPAENFDLAKFSTLAANPKVVAVGECGLDYFRIEGDVGKEKERQKKEFLLQQTFALEHNLPLMLHVRPSKGTMDAYEDLLMILDSRARGNVHFFVGSLEVAQQFWARGFSTSFTGVITFTHDYDEVVRHAPIEMILTETDAPYVAPVPHRGQRNEPAHVRLVVEQIAKIKGLPPEQVSTAVLENAARVFGLNGLC